MPLETTPGLLADSQRQVVVHALPHLPDHRDQVVQVGGVVHEVDVAGVDDQQRRLRVVEEEVVVAPGEGLQVVGVEVALVLAPAALDPLEQDLEKMTRSGCGTRGPSAS